MRSRPAQAAKLRQNERPDRLHAAKDLHVYQRDPELLHYPDINCRQVDGLRAIVKLLQGQLREGKRNRGLQKIERMPLFQLMFDITLEPHSVPAVNVAAKSKNMK